jgi:hypothetical protein
MSTKQIGDYKMKKYKSPDELKRALSFWKAAVFFMVLVIVVLIYAIDVQEDVITDLTSKVENTKALEQRLEVLDIQNQRVDELEAANEALIEVCRPSDFKEIMRLTSLPKMKRV